MEYESKINIVAFILNTPWTLLGFIFGLLSFPKNIAFRESDHAIVMRVKRLWLTEIFMGLRARGNVIGNTLLITQNANDEIYKHECVHVRQFERAPFIFPFLYLFELLNHGYRKNKYEEEARKMV